MTEFRPKKYAEDYKKLDAEVAAFLGGEDEDSEDDSEEDEKPKKQADDDGFTQVTQKKHGDRRNHIKPKVEKKEEPKVEE